VPDRYSGVAKGGPPVGGPVNVGLRIAPAPSWGRVPSRCGTRIST